MNSKTSGPDHNKTIAFDIFNDSMGFLNSCYVAQQMIAAENCKIAMIVAAESENNSDTYPKDLVGVRETSSALILDSHSMSTIGFSRFLFNYQLETLEAYTTYCNIDQREPYLQVLKDKNLEAMYISYIIPAVKELLQLEGLDLNRIDKLFPP